MSMEAQFYEALRRQHIIDRHHSFRTQKEMSKQVQQPEYRSLYIPVRVFNQDNQQILSKSIPTRRSKLIDSELSLFQRDRDIYPRAKTTRRPVRRAILQRRFSSTEYLQQW